MNSLFFWIIILSFLIPMAMRYYKKSVRGRNQNQGMPGGPDQFGQFPGKSRELPGTAEQAAARRLYPAGLLTAAFGQLGAPAAARAAGNQPYPGQQYPGQQYPGPARLPVPRPL